MAAPERDVYSSDGTNRTVYTRESNATGWFVGIIVALALIAIGYLVFSANSGPSTSTTVNNTSPSTTTPMTEPTTPAPALPDTTTTPMATPSTPAPAPADNAGTPPANDTTTTTTTPSPVSPAPAPATPAAPAQ
jgi:hypothetical protein